MASDVVAATSLEVAASFFTEWPLMDFLRMLVLGIGLVVAAVIDARTRRIPNKLVLSLLIAWVLLFVIELCLCAFGVYAAESSVQNVLVNAGKSVLSAAVVLAIIGLALFLTGRLKSKSDGLGVSDASAFGMGDVKLCAVCALYLGLLGVLESMIVACVAFLVAIVVKKLVANNSEKSVNRENPANNTLPFAPFMLVGFLVFLVLRFV